MRSTSRLARSPWLALVALAPLFTAAAAAADPYGVRLTYSSDPTTSIVVSWNSDSASDRHVVYGTAPNNLDETTAASETFAIGGLLDTSFSAPLASLRPATTYFYRVGNPGSSFYPTGDPLSFRTLPAGPCDPLRFIVIGDNRSDFDGIGPSALWPGILAEALAELPDFFLNTGDMVKNGDDGEEWHNFLVDSEVGLAQVASILTMGNHDEDDVAGDGAIYNRLFALPRNDRTNLEDYYSLDAGPIHFISLSTQFVAPGSAQLTDMLAWLEADLAATSQPWIVVFFHKAVYSKGNHSTGEENDGTINASFIPLFDLHDVDLVFNGHSHNYERYVPTTGVDEAFGGAGRFFPGGERGAFTSRTTPVPDGATGTTYVVTGGAGALTTTVGGLECEDVVCTFCTGFNINCDGDVFDADQDGYVVYDGMHNFVVVEVNGATLEVRSYATVTGNSSGGVELDRFTMTSSDFDSGLCEPPGDSGADMGGDVGGTEDLTSDDGGPEETGDDGESADEVTEEPGEDPVVDEIPSGDTGGDEAGAASTSGEDSCGCAATGQGRSAGWLGGTLIAGLWARRRRLARLSRTGR